MLAFSGQKEDRIYPLMDSFKILLEWRKKILSPIDKEQEDQQTKYNILSGKTHALHQNDSAELTFNYHLFLEQTRLMGELSALFQKIFDAWKARKDQYASLLKDQETLLTCGPVWKKSSKRCAACDRQQNRGWT